MQVFAVLTRRLLDEHVADVRREAQREVCIASGEERFLDVLEGRARTGFDRDRETEAESQGAARCPANPKRRSDAIQCRRIR